MHCKNSNSRAFAHPVKHADRANNISIIHTLPHTHFDFGGQRGWAMQNSYVQIAVCGPSRSSVLTGRRPDSTHVGMTCQYFRRSMLDRTSAMSLSPIFFYLDDRLSRPIMALSAISYMDEELYIKCILALWFQCAMGNFSKGSFPYTCNSILWDVQGLLFEQKWSPMCEQVRIIDGLNYKYTEHNENYLT